MSTRIKRFAPIGIVAIALVYLCWPYAEGPSPRPETAAAAKTKESLAALLSPEPAPAPDRDPFNSRTPPASVKHSAAPNAKAAPVKAPQAKQSASPPTATEVIEMTEVIAKARADLELQGTHIWDRHRVAVINGSVYAEGDPLKVAGATTALCKVGRIFAHKVHVQCGGQTVELTYHGHEPKPPADAPPENGVQGPSAAAHPAITN